MGDYTIQSGLNRAKERPGVCRTGAGVYFLGDNGWIRNVSLTTVMHRIRKHGTLAPFLANVHRVEIKYLKNYTRTWNALRFCAFFDKKFRVKKLVSFCLSPHPPVTRRKLMSLFRIQLGFETLNIMTIGVTSFEIPYR